MTSTERTGRITVRVALIEAGRWVDRHDQLGGRVEGAARQSHYSAAEHGVVGLTGTAEPRLTPFRG